MQHRVAPLFLLALFLAAAGSGAPELDRLEALRSLLESLAAPGPNTAGGAGNDAERVFVSQIAPILTANCIECHGIKQQKSGLRLDSIPDILKGGKHGPAIEPGRPESSRLMLAVRHSGDLEMPPGRKLAESDVKILADWIGGMAAAANSTPSLSPEAIRERRWAFQPLPAQVAPPEVKDKSWPTNPIDSFILARLEAEGLSPSPPASPEALVRRLSFDLLGLPPSPEEVAAFRAHPSPEVYAALVEKMLASPHYGERWGRHWLDVVRFAETNGFETNTPRTSAWPYRDYVIRAFNADKPYPQFIYEQLAGEATEPAATGFLVGGASDTVKSPDPELTAQQRMDELHDMIQTTGGAFLGLTVGCARCHDHKFDPISQTEYYQMQAVFAGVEHGERELRPPDYEQRLRKAELLRWRVAALDGELRRFEALANPYLIVNPVGAVATSEAKPLDLPANVRTRPPVHPRKNVDRFAPVLVRRVRLTVLATNSLEPCIDELEVFAAGESPVNRALARLGGKATASGTMAGSDAHTLEHINDGIYGNSHSWMSDQPGAGWIEIELPEEMRVDRIVWGRDRDGEHSDRLAIHYKIETATNEGTWRLVASSSDRRPFIQDAKAESNYVAGPAPGEAEELATLLMARKLASDREREARRMPAIYAGNFKEPGSTHRLHRGEALQKREEVAPGGIAATGECFSLPAGTPERERRLALAKWIGGENNPLTARVMVNRIWQHHFGEGLVATPSDFGANGVRPTHPELLDWLAREFIRRGWSMKEMHRLIVSSSAYRQPSTPRPEGLARDAGGRLLWRYPPQRLEAEAIRDAVLWSSGALDASIGGAGFEVFEPNTNYVHVYIPKRQFGPPEWRRMIYQFKPRVQQDETFGAFDCPDASQASPRRGRSTTPLQALNLLNSSFMVQQAGLFAERLRREAGDDPEAETRRAFELAFGRAPRPEEAEAAKRLVQERGLAALTRAIYNANEFVYVN